MSSRPRSRPRPGVFRLMEIDYEDESDDEDENDAASPSCRESLF
jgi:hypothetical protein